MIRRPPRSTLFPYTTSSDLLLEFAHLRGQGGLIADGAGHTAEKRRRSEEHTSELQSRQYLVCRLLLEKKKKKKQSKRYASQLQPHMSAGLHPVTHLTLTPHS